MSDKLPKYKLNDNIVISTGAGLRASQITHIYRYQIKDCENGKYYGTIVDYYYKVNNDNKLYAEEDLTNRFELIESI